MVNQINIGRPEDLENMQNSEEWNAAESEESKAMEAPENEVGGGSDEVDKGGKTADVNTRPSSKRRKARVADNKVEVRPDRAQKIRVNNRMSDGENKKCIKRNPIVKIKPLSEVKGGEKVDSEEKQAGDHEDRTVLSGSDDEETVVNEQLVESRMDADTTTTEKQVGESKDNSEASKPEDQIDEHEAPPVSEGELCKNLKIRPVKIPGNQKEEMKTTAVFEQADHSEAELLVDERKERREDGELKPNPEASQKQDKTINEAYEAIEAEEQTNKQAGELIFEDSEKLAENAAGQCMSEGIEKDADTSENQKESIKVKSVGVQAFKSEVGPLIDEGKGQVESLHSGLKIKINKKKAEENSTDSEAGAVEQELKNELGEPGQISEKEEYELVS
ncbi:hypothetical protein Aperf_G00000093934 [Anoplocephala perfoliata]